jgi:dipeptidyl aminopeptidase/acylaminoacyl peptidase
MRAGLRRAALAALGTVFVGVPAGAAPAPATKRPSKLYTIEQFLDTVTNGGASFSADDTRILFTSNRTGVFGAYSVPVKGGEPTLVASSADSTFAVSYFPNDDRVLFTRDQGGNELNHLYVKELDGTERDLTPGEKLKAAFRGWAPAGDAFYVQTNERDPRYFDLYRHDAKTYERKLVYKNDGLTIGAISDDGRYIALEKTNTTTDSDLYLWDATTEKSTLISKHEGTADYDSSDFDPETKFLYYLTNDGAEFMRVRRYDLAKGTHEEVEKADWDIWFTAFSLKGRYRTTTMDDDARTKVALHDIAQGKVVSLPGLPAGDVSNLVVSRSEKRIAFYVSSDRSPGDLFVWSPGEAAPKQLTTSLSKEIDPEDLVPSEVVRFPSFDGLTIPNILYKPQSAGAQAKAPAMVWVHGGPGGQTRRTYSALLQYLVNHGYVILGINNRGSGGYGKTFAMADDKKHGREPLWDCVAAKKYLASLPYVDGSRIGIGGGSYGGYMTLAALTYQPDVFTVGVDIFGVANWPRTMAAMPSWWEAQRKALYQEMGDPEADKERLHEISPLFHTEKIQRPLIVLQGANDPRVLKVESDEIVAAVKKNGVPVEYVVFPDEGHGFQKKKNQIEGYGAVLQFLDKHLKAAAPEAKTKS